MRLIQAHTCVSISSCCRYFTQYAGNGHGDISQFYSAEWVARSSHASGAYGRSTQRQRAAAAAGVDTNASLESQTSASSTATLASVDESSKSFETFVSAQMAKSVQQQALLNQITLRRDEISRTEKALEMAIKLRLSDTEIRKLQRQIYDMCLDKHSPCGTSLTVTTPPTQATALRAPHASDAAEFAPSNQTPASSPPAQRRCLLGTPEISRDNFDIANFSEQDVPYDGNCGFHVMKIIHDLHFPLSSRHTHESLREEIVRVMKDESANIFLSKQHCDLTGSFNVYIHEEMIQESGSIDAYCASMKKNSTCCGLNEFAAFVHMVGDGIVVYYMTTKVVRGSREVFKLARESVRPSACDYHVLHIDGKDGRDGHFMFLKPVAQCD